MTIEPKTVEPLSGCEVVSCARTWIGTPYHHQASVRGIGTDCLGLIRGIWRELYHAEPEPMSAYSKDWSANGEETLLAAARRHFEEVPRHEARPGDVLVFRYRERLPAKHCGILTDHNRFIHALEGAPVSEVAMSSWWVRRIAGTFRFPGVTV